MSDQFAHQFRRYWLVIITVILACTAVFGAQVAVMVKLATLETTMNLVKPQLDTFIAAGPRYSLQDHISYAGHAETTRQSDLKDQRAVDSEQDRRLTILENRN